MWPGGKDGAGVAQRLINQIPPHDVFVSGFLGDCALLRRKRPASLNVGIDLDRANIERWATRAPPVVASLELYCCDAIEWLRHRFDWYLVGSHDSASAAADAESGGVGRKNLAGSRERAAADPVAGMSGAAGRVAESSGVFRQRSHGWHHAERDDYGTRGAAIGGGAIGPVTFVYADPPYLMDTRRSGKRLYACEMSDERHVELLATLKGLPCLVMVSHYPCDLYDAQLAGWRSFTFEAQTRGGARAVEKVWCNYPPPEKLHDARFLGLDKRQRERVRRRVKNWTAGLARMEPLERQAVLDAISAIVGR